MSKNLAELRREHVEARRRAAERDVAQAVFAEKGEVSRADVEERLSDWQLPTAAQVDDDLALMLEGEVAYWQQQATDTSRVDGLRRKVAKIEEHLAEAKATLEAEESQADEKVGAAEDAAQEAQALLDELRGAGADPSRADTGQAQAYAEAAEVKGDS